MQNRRYDIDWIRVIAFDFLIIYHVGMFFVPWDFHIKNNVIVDWLQWPMLFLNQWRLPILFVISGMGTKFVLSHKSGVEYIKERFARLFIPLVVGILVIVSPQVYTERLTQGKVTGSFIAFYPSFFKGIYPEGNFSWNHLWFLPYLLLMSVAATPLFLRLSKENNKFQLLLKKWIKKNPFCLFLFIIPLALIEISLAPFFPVTRALIGDWYALASYFMLFLSGFILITIDEIFWEAVDRIKGHAFFFGIIAFLFLLLFWLNNEISIFILLLKAINMWCWIITIFGYASKFLNKESNIIKYRNQAVYPFYILHQTILIVIGYWLMNNSMHFIWKFVIMTIGTFGFTWIIYEFIIRRIKVIRPLFGVKNKFPDSRKVTKK